MRDSAVLEEGSRDMEMLQGARPASERSAHVVDKLATLGEMTGGIVHDLRNILTVIDSALRLAERGMDRPEGMLASIAAARQGLDRATQLTSQLLAFAKQDECAIQPDDANELLRSLGQILRYGAGPGIRLSFDLASDIPRCILDRSQFGAALLNLVVNARDAMPHGGEIRICTDLRNVKTAALLGSPAPGTYVRVRVRDAGQGISPDVMARVFDPFFTAKGEDGTGLGLPQVRAFMQRIGGYIEIASRPGMGTNVDLLFRSAEADETVHAIAVE